MGCDDVLIGVVFCLVVTGWIYNPFVHVETLAKSAMNANAGPPTFDIPLARMSLSGFWEQPANATARCIVNTTDCVFVNFRHAPDSYTMHCETTDPASCRLGVVRDTRQGWIEIILAWTCVIGLTFGSFLTGQFFLGDGSFRSTIENWFIKRANQRRQTAFWAKACANEAAMYADDEVLLKYNPKEGLSAQTHNGIKKFSQRFLEVEKPPPLKNTGVSEQGRAWNALPSIVEMKSSFYHFLMSYSTSINVLIRTTPDVSIRLWNDESRWAVFYKKKKYIFVYRPQDVVPATPAPIKEEKIKVAENPTVPPNPSPRPAVCENAPVVTPKIEVVNTKE